MKNQKKNQMWVVKAESVNGQPWVSQPMNREAAEKECRDVEMFHWKFWRNARVVKV